MGSQNDGDIGCSPSWNSATNWTVVGGCLENTVAYESFYSPINEEDAVDSSPKSPLVLRCPSSESSPCEITLHFAEKHEIRQVYVRSTARVYEMYYATNSRNENEYFCTVRCGAAMRDEQVLHTNGTEAVSAHTNEPNGDVAEANSQRGSNLNTNEYDWVEVQSPSGPALDHKSSSSPSKPGADSVRIKQDFYEATAEIADATPFSSLTIRLLSLQNKSIVYVDEIYVFANPVDSEEEGPVENSTQSSQSSLMSMLVPTLLHLSKTTGSIKSEDRRNSNAEGMHTLPEIGSKALDSTNIVPGLQQEGKSRATADDEVKLREKNESDRSVRHSELPPQVPVIERTYGKPLNRIESVLNQLVSRMDRIENCFFRFEENMLKPINSIEGRLKQVEQQLEVLSKESHGSDWPSGYRMSAPSFSANESGSNSFYNSGNDHPSCEPIEPDQKELHSGASPITLDILNSVDSSLLHPSFVVTAPEFSNGDDDDQEVQVLEIAIESPKSKPKPSIDDVLASALAQFALSSSSSITTPEYTKPAALSPAEFLNEDRNNNRKASLSDLSEIEIDHISCSQETDSIQCTTNSASASLSSANGGNLSPSRHDHSSDIDCKYQSVDGDVGVASKGKEEVREEDVSTSTSEDCVPETSDIPIHPLHRHPENGPNDTDADAMEFTKEGCGIDIVHDVLGFSRKASIVDFEIPILDVSFTSIAYSSCDGTLKDLLGVMAELNYGAPCVEESDDATLIGEQSELILVGEEENQENSNSRNGPVSLDMNYCTIMGEPLIADGENMQDDCNNSTVISSLI